MSLVAFRNRHPADALAEIRAEIKQLQIQEAELRGILRAEGADRCGVQYDAVVYNSEQLRLDEEAVVEHFGKDVLQPFYRAVSFQAVRLKRHISSNARNPRVYKAEKKQQASQV